MFSLSMYCSIHRFIGYDLKHMVGQHISFVADLVLLLLLFIIWKPICLGLIYFELWLRIIALSVQICFHFVCETAGIAINTSLLVPLHKILSKGKFTVDKSMMLLVVPITVTRRRKAKKLLECVSCAFSLSLLLRFISGRSANFESRRHDELARVSVLYRIFRHII
jgi:hypothetical protein